MVNGGSPTLVGSARYLSVLAPVPDALGERIASWRARHTPDQRHHAHITVHVCREPAHLAARLEIMRQRLADHGPVAVKLGEPASFEPESPVTYLPVTHGAQRLTWLNQLSAQVLGPSASPFPFIPHLTLGMRLPAPALAESLRHFAQIPEELDHFEVDQLLVSEYESGQWWDHAVIPLHR